METMEPTIVVGRNPVREALEHRDRRLEKVMLQRGLEGGWIAEIRSAAKEAGVPVQVVPSQRLGRLASGATHQGVAAVLAPVAYRDVDEMLAEIAPGIEAVRAQKPVLVLLDGIEDPRNFGAILRSVAAAGVQGVIVPDRGMAPMSAVTVKASAGTALRIPIARVNRLSDTIQALKERGYWVAGLAGDEPMLGDPDHESLWDYDWDRPVAVVIGSEGEGLQSSVRSACDVLVSIPMRGDVESLNASVAAGVALFAAVRGRH